MPETTYGKQASDVLVITAMQQGRSYTAEAESAGMTFGARPQARPPR